ncbi:hypothetical protein E2C01_020852 [Portunus trituberculatus]|uniref:Uncharacterized protein n=1 Tax=Portunus trituberculatus TaxID=210409 RepID=A0A5B7E364_PORTR|nr:hypothetical protein [Portunus trituberculatus]
MTYAPPLRLSHIGHTLLRDSRLPVVPCMYIHTLCPSSEEKITTQGLISQNLISAAQRCSVMIRPHNKDSRVFES